MRRKSNTISRRQFEILKYIINKVNEHGYPPTVREICNYLSLNSPATIHSHLNKLEELGYIKRDPLKPRAIEVNLKFKSLVQFQDLEELKDYAEDQLINYEKINYENKKSSFNFNKIDNLDSLNNYKNNYPNNNVVMIPILGKIAAGTPILAVENIDDYFPLPSDFLKNNNNVFILQVKGDSMVNAGILDRDFAIIRQQDTAMNGEIIAALVDDEATIKRFFIKNNVIKLMPENDFMKPIILKEIKILGKVIGIIRKYF